MAPAPVVVLCSAWLIGIHAISLMVFVQVATVCAVFMIIPVVIVLMVPVVDSDLDTGILGLRGGHDCHRCCEKYCQQYGVDVTMCVVHVDVLQGPRFKTLGRGRETMHAENG